MRKLSVLFAILSLPSISLTKSLIYYISLLLPMVRKIIVCILLCEQPKYVTNTQYLGFIRFYIEPGEEEHQMLHKMEALNTQLAIAGASTVKETFDLDYTEGNMAARMQLNITLRFREIVQSGEVIRNIDDYMDPETASVVQQFSQASRVHDGW